MSPGLPVLDSNYGKKTDSSKVIVKTIENLSVASGIEEITGIVSNAARLLTGADGATFVFRDADKCYYADEDAISPLWKGKRFPIEACISGWAMINRQIVCIPDIYKDDRIPHDAYRPTFVKSLCMVPIRSASPIGAIGNYWSTEYTPSPENIKQLQVLADCTSVAVENWELKNTVEKRSKENAFLHEKHHELELSMHTLVHDLRNPICSILAFTDMLQTYLEPQLDPRATAYFESINRIINRLSLTIGQMLTLYKLTSQEISKQVTDLSIIGKEVEAQLRAQEPERSVKVIIDEQMVAETDPLLIRLAIENLFVNAYKFTRQKDKPEIHFGKASTDGGKWFFVKDNGVGFDEKETDKLFKPLSRLHGSQFAGTGLGLASVAQIVKAHGGTVRAEGKIDQGATFYFSV